MFKLFSIVCLSWLSTVLWKQTLSWRLTDRSLLGIGWMPIKKRGCKPGKRWNFISSEIARGHKTPEEALKLGCAFRDHANWSKRAGILYHSLANHGRRDFSRTMLKLELALSTWGNMMTAQPPSASTTEPAWLLSPGKLWDRTSHMNPTCG